MQEVLPPQSEAASDPSPEEELETPLPVMPFDTLCLTMFKGRIDPECIGPVFPDMETIAKRFNLLQHCHPVETEDGQWVQTLWRVKSHKEMARTKLMMEAVEYNDPEKFQELVSLYEEAEQRKEASKQAKAKKRENTKNNRNP